jgi:AraC-like DNA-binding protein
MANWSSYRTPSPVHRRLGLVCLGVGTEEGLLHCPPRTLDSYAAVLLTAGAGELTTESRRFRLHAPVLFWLRPGQPHSYGSDPGGWSDHWVLFDGPAARGYAELGYLAGGSPTTTFDDITPVRRAFVELARVCQQGGPDTDVEAAVRVHLLLAAIRRGRADYDRSTIPVLTALRQDALLPLTVAEHARRLGLTADQLRGTVRALTGFGVKDYLLQLRLSRAKDLLADTTLPIARVAREVGYADAAYFSRIFTRRVGSSPSRFRDQLSRP